MKSYSTLFILLFTISVHSQTISTFYQNASIDDGLAFDSAGNLYGSHYTGSIVWKITPEGVRSIFMAGLDTPNGLAFDSEGNLHIVDNQGGAIHKVAPDSTVTTYVPNIYSPSGIIKMPTSDTMIVSSWEGDKLIKVAPNGSLSDFVVGNGLEGPVGMAYKANGDLLVGNYNDRWIFNISPEGVLDTLTRLTVAGNNIGFIAYKDDFVYATIPWDNKIYKVDMDGNYELYAGSGPGNTDGDLSVAKFNGPNGIIFSPGGDSMYISDFNSRSVRIITNLNGPVGTDNFSPISSIQESKISPNPVVQETNLDLMLSEQRVISILVFNINGQLEDTIINNKNLQAGTHNFPIDLREMTKGTHFIQIKTNQGEELVKKLIKIE
jgi:sugar lactone lactonase YvrE